MSDVDKKARTEGQIKVLETLQDKILADFVKILESNTASATDRATIVRLLQSNGWTLDPSQLPSDLKSKLTSLKRFDEDLSEDETGAPKIRLAK